MERLLNNEGVILEALRSTCSEIAVDLAKTLRDKACGNLSRSWEVDKVVKGLFGQCDTREAQSPLSRHLYCRLRSVERKYIYTGTRYVGREVVTISTLIILIFIILSLSVFYWYSY